MTTKRKTTKRKTKAKWSRYTLKRKFGGRWYGLGRIHAYGEGKTGPSGYYAKNDALTKKAADAEVKYWRAKGVSARKVKVKDGWLVYRRSFGTW
jgi:hypothetical protein